MAEAAQYSDNTFVTLTYSEDRVSLAPGDLRDFIKRLRSRVAPHRFRFYAVGEYGDKTQRPHYHACLFNFPTCLRGRSRYSKLFTTCCSSCELVRETWGHGHVYLGAVEPASAEYVARYVVKKLTNKDDERLNGRHPEFARMSLKPGIGAHAMFDVADTLLNYQNTLDAMGDVPGELMVGKARKPIGRYLRKKLRSYVGRDEKAPQATMDKIAADLRPLRLAARQDAQNPSLKAKMIEASSGARARQQTRMEIFTKRGSL